MNTPVGGATLALTSYVWCGAQPCQARNAASMPTREYYAEGEVLPGATPTMLYYGLDQIGGVRRVFASSGASPAYTYDPYGAPLQAAAPITDRGYAGMLTEPNSGLGLTLYRAYNPAIGRWLSRDPAGEATDQSLNLYGYVDDDPINAYDPLGLCPQSQNKSCAVSSPATYRNVAQAALDRAGGGGQADAYTNDFSTLDKIPDLSNWVSGPNSHGGDTQSYENFLGCAGFVTCYAVKIYLNDARHGGLNTVAIIQTDPFSYETPSLSILHFIDYFRARLSGNDDLNQGIASDYASARGICL